MTRPSLRVLVTLALGLTALAGAVAYYIRHSGPGTDYDAALQAIDRRDFRTASELLDRHLAANPQDTDARLLAARTARRRGAYDDFHKHLAVHKEQNGPARARTLEHRLSGMQRGELQEAEQHLLAASAATADPESPLLTEAVIEGCLLALQGRSGQASRPPAGAGDPLVLLARRAVELWLNTQTSEAGQVQGLVWRGRVRAAAGDHDDAVADFRMALQRDPQHFDARFQLAMTIGSGNPVEAATLFEQLHQVEPDNDLVLSGLAISYRLLGRPVDASAILHGLVDKGADDPRLLNELGQTELELGNYTEAEKVLRRTLAKHPDDLVANLAMSRCMILAGRTDEAARFQERYERAYARAKGPRVQANKP